MQIHSPASVGLSADRLDRIGALNQRYVDQQKLPGFISLVARHGKIAYLDTRGYMDIATQTPYQPDTIVRMYSMTKPITSMALLMLYEQSLFDFFDPIAAYLPEFKDVQVYDGGELAPLDRPITIFDLLTHTSGLTYGSFGDPLAHPVNHMYDAADIFGKNKYPSLAAAVKKIASLPLRFQPGQQWEYSVSTDVLGRLVEVLSGQSLGAFMEQHIFQPLGMVDTMFGFSEDKQDRVATLYTVTPENPLAVADHPSQSHFSAPAAAHFGGGGLLSTAEDYFQFASCLLNKGTLNGNRLLGRKTVERMQMNHMPERMLPIAWQMNDVMHGMGFGLGLSVAMDITQTGEMGTNGQYGWGGFAETTFWVDPAEQLIAMNLTQCLPASFYPVRTQFRTAVYQSLVE